MCLFRCFRTFSIFQPPPGNPAEADPTPGWVHINGWLLSSPGSLLSHLEVFSSVSVVIQMSVLLNLLFNVEQVEGFRHNTSSSGLHWETLCSPFSLLTAGLFYGGQPSSRSGAGDSPLPNTVCLWFPQFGPSSCSLWPCCLIPTIFLLDCCSLPGLSNTSFALMMSRQEAEEAPRPALAVVITPTCCSPLLRQPPLPPASSLSPLHAQLWPYLDLCTATLLWLSPLWAFCTIPLYVIPHDKLFTCQ